MVPPLWHITFGRKEGLCMGKIIDEKWIVIGKSGHGGQGDVYKVLGDDSKEYALKYLSRQADAERRTRMFSEVTNVSSLDSPHLMKIVFSNVKECENMTVKLYYVSEYINGYTLEEYVKKHDVSFDEAKAFFEKFLEVLSYCHEKKVIHRDIKPENIMLRNGVLLDFVLIDFGLSFNIDEQEDITETDQQLGNRFILLPELVSGTRSQKRVVESDISQACGVFFYLLTGLIPHSLIDGEGKRPHKREKAQEILKSKIVNSIAFNNVCSLFDRAFANNIEERFHSCVDVQYILSTIADYRVNALGGGVMNIESDGMTIDTTESVYKYPELMKQLNPTTEICNPAGLSLPMITNVIELINYGVALPDQIRKKAVKYYSQGDYATAASQIWQRAINLLKKRILSLGEEFVADMVGTDDIEYVRNLPTYRLIDLAHDLGFIDKAGRRKLFSANEYYNYFNNDESDEYEEMPQDEANIIIKSSISYILYSNDDSFGFQFNDFREKLKSGKVSELFVDEKTMFATCPYFYLKTSVRSLLKLFGETEGIEYENVTANMGVMIPAFWERLKIEERRALADAYTDYTNKNDYTRTAALNPIMLQVHGFDYVMENVRSRTYISVAQKLKDAHFEMNNFYTEPGIIQKLEDLGTAIPTLALKECVTAILYVKLGNQYGTSWNAEPVADRLLDRLTRTDWETYIDKYMYEESNLVEEIQQCVIIRNRWKDIIKKYKLNELSVMTSEAKRLISIK